ncbi:sulfur oxidation c-type cytochrome SoxX [Cupriavidus neocaledonicus]|uniref:Cytochrome of the thiosulfate-oxidizing multi-enzyme system, putative soxX homolog n=1 Tax=Cupriavidus neocaledonicus TaxID=1040979 RepID=A0A375HC36_9BURK|nr:sulfur oxidation c-type cytochrome SoxX [Cupriavidus neocaledonicus]SOZ36464.1 cytochrome of the thiosulfate-oxidizing multi-enzyme system, putative soxX homolog [Cupriavidus neocaledonicus]SPD48448.1 Monoheme cytochrome SoxX (Sulfur oxidation) [Cupriavidus neocaledonicus]
MQRHIKAVAVAALAALLANGAYAQDSAQGSAKARPTKGKPAAVSGADMKHLIEDSFSSRGPVTVEGVLNQDGMQQACSQYPDRTRVPARVAKKIEAAELKQIKYPADDKWLGDWKEGEKVAQNGRGMQFTDQVGGTNGGNCYACHQMTKAEISFGNIGPSLYQYGKLRGNSQEVIKYTWGKIWDSSAYAACSNMPRFGHKGILTEAQIRDVMALLLDPASPVNQ